MNFARSEFLALLALVPVAALWFAWSMRRRHALLSRLGERAQVERLLGSVRAGLGGIRTILWTLALALLVLAMARPQFGEVDETVLARGVDVLIAVDVSSSMLATDVEPRRLDRAREQLGDLARRLRGHRIGLIAFAGAPVLQCPLTMDLSVLLTTLSIVNPWAVGAPGTSLASAVRLAIQSFDEDSPRHRVLVLLTDAEDHRGELLEAAREAKEAGVVIHAIGIGSEEGAVVPELNRRTGRIEGIKRDESGNPVISRLGTEALDILASETGGLAFASSSLGQVEIDRIARAIEALPQEAIEEERIQHLEEQYQLFLCPAIALLLIDALLLAGRRRRRRWLVQATAATAFAFAAMGGAPADSAARLNNEAVEMMGEDQTRGALDLLRQAQAEDPAAEEILLNLGLAHRAAGNMEEAARHFDEALASESGDLASAARYNLGTLHLERARTALASGEMEGAEPELEQAISSLREAVLMGDDSRPTRRNLQIARELLQQLQRMQQQQQQQNQQQQDEQSQEGDEQQQQQSSDQQQDQEQDQQQSEESKKPPQEEQSESQQQDQEGEGESDQQQDASQQAGSEQQGEQEMTPEEQAAQQQAMEEQRRQDLAETYLDLYPFEEDREGMQRLMGTVGSQQAGGPDW